MNDYRPNSFNVLPLVIKNLLIINGLVYLASLTPMVQQYAMQYLPLYYFELPQFIPTQFITYQFVHAMDPRHIIFNMFSLWMFGSLLENVWGPKKFLTFYLLSGVGAGLFNMLYTWFILNYMPGASNVAGVMIGASGSVYGLLLAYAFLFPNSYLNLYFFIPIKAKYFVGGLIAIDLLGGLFANDGIAHFAHIGGALTGLIILLIWKSRGKLWG